MDMQLDGILVYTLHGVIVKLRRVVVPIMKEQLAIMKEQLAIMKEQLAIMKEQLAIMKEQLAIMTGFTVHVHTRTINLSLLFSSSSVPAAPKAPYTYPVVPGG